MGIIHSTFCALSFLVERVSTWLSCGVCSICLLFMLMLVCVYGITVGYHYAQKEIAQWTSAYRLYRKGIPDWEPPPHSVYDFTNRLATKTQSRLWSLIKWMDFLGILRLFGLTRRHAVPELQQALQGSDGAGQDMQGDGNTDFERRLLQGNVDQPLQSHGGLEQGLLQANRGFNSGYGQELRANNEFGQELQVNRGFGQGLPAKSNFWQGLQDNSGSDQQSQANSGFRQGLQTSGDHIQPLQAGNGFGQALQDNRRYGQWQQPKGELEQNLPANNIVGKEMQDDSRQQGWLQSNNGLENKLQDNGAQKLAPDSNANFGQNNNNIDPRNLFYRPVQSLHELQSLRYRNSIPGYRRPLRQYDVVPPATQKQVYRFLTTLYSVIPDDDTPNLNMAAVYQDRIGSGDGRKALDLLYSTTLQPSVTTVGFWNPPVTNLTTHNTVERNVQDIREFLHRFQKIVLNDDEKKLRPT